MKSLSEFRAANQHIPTGQTVPAYRAYILAYRAEQHAPGSLLARMEARLAANGMLNETQEQRIVRLRKEGFTVTTRG